MKKTVLFLLIISFVVCWIGSCKSNPSTLTSIPTSSSASASSTPTPTSTLSQFLVTSSADAGPGTFRQALIDAQKGETITFDPIIFPPESPTIIKILSPLPTIVQENLTVNGSDAGVIIDGSSIPPQTADANGLTIVSDWNSIQGLQFINFPGAGIVLTGANNTIGGDRGVGTGPKGQGNTMSRNEQGIGIWNSSATGNSIIGNLIGITPNEQAESGNHLGIYISNGANHNIIGPSNIIAHNTIGITITSSDSRSNTITRNNIYSNDANDIQLTLGGNDEPFVPAILDFDLDAGTATGFTCSCCIVEIFSVEEGREKTYEGSATAGIDGFFTFKKSESFIGSQLTATTTDLEGSTSSFSNLTSGTSRLVILQSANTYPKHLLVPIKSPQLEDNRLGAVTPLHDFPSRSDIDLFLRFYSDLALKWLRLTEGWPDWNEAAERGEYSDLYIAPVLDEVLNGLVDNGIQVMYMLLYWDKSLEPWKGYSRFETEDDIQRFLEYVRFTVRHYKGEVQYYELWNEPGIGAVGTQQYIDPEKYIELAMRVIPVIHEEDPLAKIVVPAIDNPNESEGFDYLFEIIESDLMPLVDGISWHPLFSISPEFQPDIYYRYPSLISEIKNTASEHGFRGEFIAEELRWRTAENPSTIEYSGYGIIPSAKYHARGMIMHLGNDVRTGFALENLDHLLPLKMVIQNIGTTMAGAKPANVTIEIQSEAANIVKYSFSLPNGDRLIALWSDIVAVDEDPGLEADLTVPSLVSDGVTGIDVLYGFEQQLITNTVDGNLIIHDLLIKDYPIILRFTNVTPP